MPRRVFTIIAASTLTLTACSGGETGESTDASAGQSSAQSGTASAGETVFRRCISCHSVEPGENRVGPTLHAVVGRDIGGVSGFNYSDANAGTDGEWTPESLNSFLENPRTFMPGTTMAFAGIPNEQDRADLIAYLETLD